MGEHLAIVSWNRNEQPFVDNRYSRRHQWEFDGGAFVMASASPHVVPLPFCDPAGVDPEEAFVAALASCHMLWFLSIAAKRGFVIESYRDRAVGAMEKDANGRLAITEVELHPHTVVVGPRQPTEQEIHAMHEEAHGECFIANSVKTKLTTVPTFA